MQTPPACCPRPTKEPDPEAIRAAHAALEASGRTIDEELAARGMLRVHYSLPSIQRAPVLRATDAKELFVGTASDTWDWLARLDAAAAVEVAA